MQNKTYAPVFLKGSTGKHMLRMTFAAYTALLVVQVADLLALFYVAAVASEVEVAGLGVAMTLFFLAFVVNMGCAIAVSTYVAFSSVEDTDDILRSKTTSAIAWTAMAGFLSSIILLLLMPYLCDLLGLTGAARETAIRYLTILAPVNGVQAFAMGCAASMRGLGRAKDGMLITLVGAAVNLAVDPILILYWGLGVDGAAYGVWAGRVVQVGVGIYLLRKANLFTGLSLATHMSHLRPLARLAAPAAVAGAAAPVGAAFLMYVVAPFGDAARSSIFVVDRVSALAFGFAMSLANSIGGIVAQNYKAGLPERAMKTFATFIMVSSGYMVIAGSAVALMAPTIVDLFGITSPEGRNITTMYLQITGIGWAATSLINGSNAVFQNTNRPTYSMYMNWLRVFCGVLPCWQAAQVFGMAEIAIQAYVAGLAACGIAAALFAFSMLRIDQTRTVPG